MPKTPAPDEITHVRGPSAAGYGMNNDPNSPSVAPGKRVLSPLAANLESSVDDDGVQAHVIAHGTAMPSPDFQTRAVSDKGYPPAHGMRSRTASDGSPGDTVPAKIGSVQGDPVRKPGA